MGFKFSFLFSAFLFFSFFAQAQTAGSSSTQPSYRLNGSATLATNFIEKGLTQTKGDPGLQTDFWFNFGSQFRMGLWGANVRYDSTPSTHFWLKANADVKVDFSAETKLNIVYNQNLFYKANRRNGNTVGLHFDFWGWKVHYDMDSNWEGTRKKATYMGVGTDTVVWGDWIWSNMGGYTMSEADGVSSYFDYRTGLGTKIKDFMLKGNFSMTTISGEYKDQGEMAIFFTANVTF